MYSCADLGKRPHKRGRVQQISKVRRQACAMRLLPVRLAVLELVFSLLSLNGACLFTVRAIYGAISFTVV